MASEIAGTDAASSTRQSLDSRGRLLRSDVRAVRIVFEERRTGARDHAFDVRRPNRREVAAQSLDDPAREITP